MLGSSILFSLLFFVLSLVTTVGSLGILMAQYGEDLGEAYALVGAYFDLFFNLALFPTGVALLLLKIHRTRQ